jgi:N-acetylglucosamine-6-phosphate deacetylase
VACTDTLKWFLGAKHQQGKGEFCMRFTLRNVHLVDATTDMQGDITIEGTRIQASSSSSDEPGTVIDAAGMTVMPGFIDVHTHGGGGCNLHTTDEGEILAYARWVPQTGVTAFLIGVVGTPDTIPEAQLRTAVSAIEHWEEGAQPLGIHMEGPYINVARRGAHLPSWLRLPDMRELESILTLTRGYLRLMTLAPELPGAADMIRRLVEEGITASMGHTDATYEQAQEAIRLGVTHVTHCFNAMRSLHHRAPGPVAAAAQAPQVRGELIADGVHVHPAMMDALIKLLGPERTIIITDALAAAGSNVINFEFAGQPAQILCGAAHLADGTLTGSVLRMDTALHNLLQMTGISLQEAVTTLTLNPALSAHAAESKGRLQSGYDADLLLFDASLHLQATFCRGRLAFASDAWQSRLDALNS